MTRKGSANTHTACPLSRLSVVSIAFTVSRWLIFLPLVHALNISSISFLKLCARPQHASTR